MLRLQVNFQVNLGWTFQTLLLYLQLLTRLIQNSPPLLIHFQGCRLFEFDFLDYLMEGESQFSPKMILKSDL